MRVSDTSVVIAGTAELEALLLALQSRKAAIVAEAARETDIEAERLGSGFDRILDFISRGEVGDAQARSVREASTRLATQGIAPERVLAAYLSLNWAVWEVVSEAKADAPAAALELADRQMRGLHVAVEAMAEAYADVEVALAAAHAERRRSVLEELLSAPRETPDDRARVRRHSERYGLAPDGTYRLTVIEPVGYSDDALAAAEDGLERTIRAPVPHHRRQPGIRLPVVLEWRGRLLVLARSDWTGVPRLREGLARVMGDAWVAVDVAHVGGFEAISVALGQAEYAVGVAAGLGYRGWVGDPGTVALETTFLLDDTLVRSAIDHELGGLLADQRMGNELLETLEVYLGCGQNSREAARQLHLSPRTVAYRLERVESLLGRKLDTRAGLRLSAAILALRATRQTGKPR
jgi:hypothetical protein